VEDLQELALDLQHWKWTGERSGNEGRRIPRGRLSAHGEAEEDQGPQRLG
jgi:hypothetical protein